MKSLVLGTAQWASGYGVTNSSGRLSDHEFGALLETAKEFDITELDTAPGYGDTEERLRPWASQFEVVTKVKGEAPELVTASLMVSSSNLGQERLRGCLVHDWPSLTPQQASQTARELEAARIAGYVLKVGISAYTEQDIVRAAEEFEQLDLIQVPCNPLDRRLDESSVLQELAAAGTIVEARSVFLQGVLLSPSTTKQGSHLAVMTFHDALLRARRSPLEACLAHVKSFPWISKVVVGVSSVTELTEIAKSWRLVEAERMDSIFGTTDEALIDPRNW